jgi:hypothetical protein
MVRKVRDDRREKERVPCRIPTMYSVDGTERLDYAFDLSERGMGLICVNPPPLGHVTRVRFVHPYNRRDLWADAKFVWIEDDGPAPRATRRAGLRFLTVDRDVQILLADLVRSVLGKSTAAAVPPRYAIN